MMEFAQYTSSEDDFQGAVQHSGDRSMSMLYIG